MSLQYDVYVSRGERQVMGSCHSALVDSCEMICARRQSLQRNQPTPRLVAVSVQFEYLTEEVVSFVDNCVSTRKLDYEANTSC